MALSLNRFAYPSSVQLADVLYQANGIDQPWWTDCLTSSRTEERISTTAPSAAPSGGSGSVNANALADGNYRIWVTFVRTAGSTFPEMESGACPVPRQFTLSGGPRELDLTDIPVSTDDQVDARRIYIKGAAIKLPRLALTIADNTTDTGTLDESADEYNDYAVMREAVGDYPLKRGNSDGQPPIFEYLAGHQQRLWGTKGANIYYSEPKPYHEDFPSTNVLEAPAESGLSENITGLVPFREQLLVFRDDAVFNITGVNLETYEVDRLMSGFGAPTAHCVVPYGGYLYWLDRQRGPVRWNGGPKPDREFSNGIRGIWNRIDQNRLRVSRGAYVPSLDEIIWFVTEGRYDRHNRILVLEMVTGQFSYDEFHGSAAGVIRNEMGKKYVLVGNTLGDIHQYDIGAADAAYEGTLTGTASAADGTTVTISGATLGDADDIEGCSVVLTDSDGELLDTNQMVKRVSATTLKTLYPVPADVSGVTLGGIYVSRETPWMKFDAEGPIRLSKITTMYEYDSDAVEVSVWWMKPDDTAWTLVGTFTTDGDGRKEHIFTKRAEWHKLRYTWNTQQATTVLTGYTIAGIPTRGK